MNCHNNTHKVVNTSLTQIALNLFRIRMDSHNSIISTHAIIRLVPDRFKVHANANMLVNMLAFSLEDKCESFRCKKPVGVELYL